MTPEMAVEILRSSVVTTLTMLAPILATAIIVGLIVSIFQTVTSIQEQTLTFVPKMLAVGGALILSANWMIRSLVEYSTWLIEKIPYLAR